MSRLKPIGSEKLKGQAQINRILEIAKYKENLPNSINENEKIDYTTKLVDGNIYHIVRETKGYIIKVGLNESVAQYIEPMQNRHYYGSYAEALKRLNLLAKELNRVHNINEGISLFTEDKKYFLKTPKPEGGEDMGEAEVSTPPAPMPEPMPAPAEGGETPPPAEPDGGEDMGVESEMPEMPSDEMPEEGPEEADTDVTFKSIQKLTGKLAQKIRDFQSKGEEELSSKDAKYVVNSILSSLADNLEDDDKDDIIEKLEGEEEEGMGGEEPMDMEGGEMPEEEPMDMGGGEMPDEPSIKGGGEVGETYNMEMDMNEKYLDKVMGGLFGESKVDKILSNYFVLSENEIKFRNEKKKQKQLFLEQKTKSDKNQIVRLSETVKQKKVAIDVINSFPEMKFVGKTNKGNLVFEHNNKQLKVSPKGELL
jgi:hypothetical protein